MQHCFHSHRHRLDSIPGTVGDTLRLTDHLAIYCCPCICINVNSRFVHPADGSGRSMQQPFSVHLRQTGTAAEPAARFKAGLCIGVLQM